MGLVTDTLASKSQEAASSVRLPPKFTPGSFTPVGAFSDLKNLSGAGSSTASISSYSVWDVHTLNSNLKSAASAVQNKAADTVTDAVAAKTNGLKNATNILSSASGSLSSAISKYTGAAGNSLAALSKKAEENVCLLAKTSFSAGALDKLAAPDIYASIKTNATINKIKSITETSVGSAFSDLAGNSKATAKELGLSALSLMRNKGKLTNAQSLARVLGSSPTLNKAFGGLNGGFQNVLKAGLNTSSLPASIKVIVDGKINNIDLKNPNSFNELKAMQKAITGKDMMEKKDPAAIGKFLSLAANSALDMGVDGTTKDLLQFGTDQKVMDAMAVELSEKIAKKSASNDLLNIANSATPGVIHSSNPKIVYEYCKAYSATKKLTFAQSKSEYDTLIAAFTKIDPSWNVKVRNGETLKDITDIECSNESFFTLLNYVIVPTATEATQEVAYLCARYFKHESVEDLLKVAYPEFAFSFNNQATQINSAFD